MNIPMILAPAGGRAQFFSALNSGADAVYLGLKEFNARARAENFSPQDLAELLPLAREHRMQVLVTLNILVKECEKISLIDTLATLEELNVDAIIVQDLGVAAIARKYFPKLRLHASTQMAIHNLAGVKEAIALGFRRVVLARELTIQEIRKIRSSIPQDVMELEVFCHGSLCYSYSGLCFFSGSGDARSGNRGECAYTCRVPYKIRNEPGHGFLFSMRDLDTSDILSSLVEAGVDTLKIEGRKKDAQYVSTTVGLYRKRLDEIFQKATGRNEISGEPEKDLSFSFQRQKTSFFMKGRYQENVIDLDNPTHHGLLIGTIKRVVGRKIEFVTKEPLERFDGLRVLAPSQVYHSAPQNGVSPKNDGQAMKERYEGKNLEFSLREMRVSGRSAVEAFAGDLVSIEIPQELNLPNPGDVVRKIRSADLKRRVEKLSHPPKDSRLRPLSPVSTKITGECLAEHIKISASVMALGELIQRAEIQVPKVRAESENDPYTDLEKLFNIYGEAGFFSENLDIESEAIRNFFIPRSSLKKLKVEVSKDLKEAYDRFCERRRGRVISELSHQFPIKTIPFDSRNFSIKIDRLEYLEPILSFCEKNPQFLLKDIIFEPKRSFLTELDPQKILHSLQAFQLKKSNIKIRFALPTVVRAWDEPLLKRWFQAAKQVGINHFEVGNLGGVELLRSWGVSDDNSDIAADFSLYALHSQASRFWFDRKMSHVTLNVEDDYRNIHDHAVRLEEGLRAKLQVVLYKDTPLFIAEACSLTALHDGCPTAKVCGYRTLEIENPKGEVFFVGHETCKSIVYAKEAFSITHRQESLLSVGIGQFRVDFLTRHYEPKDLLRVLQSAVDATELTGTQTANFDRSLL